MMLIDFFAIKYNCS